MREPERMESEMTAEQTRADLVRMSRSLGDPSKDYVILGEGNTSARIDDERFYVKASGTQMATIGEHEFVEVRGAPVLEMVDAGDLSDGQILERLMDACVWRGAMRPSVETVLHAVLLQAPQISFVGHTHPTAVNAILCSERWRELLAGRLFPDEIVVCGPAPALIPYVDPGLPLACAVRDGLRTYVEGYGEPPKVILMQNHGLIALGATASAVENATAMAVKAARVILAAAVVGGLHYLSPEHVARIHTRPDEEYRKRFLEHTGGGPGGPARPR